MLTSVNGVERLFALLRENRVDLRKLAGCRFAAIGPATAAALAAQGIQPDLCPATATGEELGRLLIASVPAGQPILLLRAENSTPLLPAMLREAGYPVEEHSLYRTVYQPLRPALAGETLVFGSAAGVRAYAEAFGAPGAGVQCVCIGPSPPLSWPTIPPRPLPPRRTSRPTASWPAWKHCNQHAPPPAGRGAFSYKTVTRTGPGWRIIKPYNLSARRNLV